MEMMPYIWFGIALFMAIIEGVTYQLVSIWFVLGAVVSAIVSIFVPENILVTNNSVYSYFSSNLNCYKTYCKENHKNQEITHKFR